MTVISTGQEKASDISPSGKSKDTLPQFVARVLDQLSISAWLPSAALILSIAFIFELGAALDNARQRENVAQVMGEALTMMASINLGGAALFIVGIVVLTMISQAFEFEAIRVLEGYWGTNRLVERVAKRRCNRFRKERKRLVARRKALTRSAWKGARRKIIRQQDSLVASGEAPTLTPSMMKALEERAMGREPTVRLTGAEDQFVLGVNWRNRAPSEPLRQLVNVDKRLRDYPSKSRILPTRLGNVLRSYEDETGVQPIESFIQEVFDELPLSLRTEHDEQRSRLDLYCSMVFIFAVIAIIAFLRLGPAHLLWAISAVLVSYSGMCLMYRAAIATAQAYGSILVTIAGSMEK